MRTRVLPLLLSCSTLLSAQTYFYIDAIEVQPAQPTPADDININLIGGLSSTGAYVVSSSASVVGNLVTITIVAADPGGFTVIVPHTETVNVGQLPAGPYTMNFNTTNVGDFAPDLQHVFTVSGGGTACDSLLIHSVLWHPFTDTAVVVHAYNYSFNTFPYPNFILFDANGDTLAQEEATGFGIPYEVDSWHVLGVQAGATLPVDPFNGTLELWINFTTELACTFADDYELCPPGPCVPMVPMIQNFGGGITIGSYAWNINNADNEMVATGLFTMTETQQYDTANVCLPPGEYSMVTVPLNEPTGGQPVFSVTLENGISGPSQGLTWDTPVPMPFSFYAPCAETAQAVPEGLASSLNASTMGNAIRVWRTDGAPLGAVAIFDAQGRLVARATSTASELLLPLGAQSAGLFILHTSQGRVKLVVDL